jgi:hypothetical protein
MYRMPKRSAIRRPIMDTRPPSDSSPTAMTSPEAAAISAGGTDSAQTHRQGNQSVVEEVRGEQSGKERGN